MIRKLIFGIIIFQILINGYYESKNFLEDVHSLKEQQEDHFYRLFSPLRPWLHNIFTVGYITCEESSRPMIDVPIMLFYQKAQIILSPTILDFNNTRYPLVILECSNPQRRLDRIQKLGNFKTLYQNHRVVLLKKRQ